MYNAEIGVGCASNSGGCQNQNGCSDTPDFCIKRNDTRPSMKVSMEDCDGVVDLTDPSIILEASMWFLTKLKTQIDVSSVTFSFADNIGFDQVLVGDVIIMDRPRNPEFMLISSINEISKSVTVTRGHNSTTPQSWAQGSSLRVFRFKDEPGQIDSVFEDVFNLDGTTTNQLTETFLVFNWSGSQTSLPGCYFLEFKLLKIGGSSVEWTKRIPLSKEGYVISILDSPTAEV